MSFKRLDSQRQLWLNNKLKSMYLKACNAESNELTVDTSEKRRTNYKNHMRTIALAD